MDDKVISIEGHGSRPSHQGPGYSAEGKMFTINTVEKHAVCYKNIMGAAKADYESEIQKPIRKEVKRGMICYGISRSMLKGGMNAGGMPVEENLQPAILANGTGAVCYKIIHEMNKAVDAHYEPIIIDHSRRHSYQQLDVIPTLEAHMGTGGGNVPLILIRK